jgi:branched-chain amino acid transport system permease protein
MTTVQYCIDAIAIGGLYALIALGLAMTFGIARIINLAQSELIMVPAYLILLTASFAWPLIIVVALGGAVALALVMELIVFRPLRGASETTMLVASFGLSLGIQSIIRAIAGDKPRGTSFGAELSSTVDVGGLSISKLDIATIAVTVVALIALAVFLRRFPVGVQLRAAAEDFDMASLLGVRAQWMICLAFAISGLTAGLASIMITARSGGLTPTIGIQPLLVGVIALVLGGMVSLAPAVAGGFLLGALTVVLGVSLPGGALDYQDAFLYVIVILVLLFRPRGLFARAASAERV